MSDPSSPVPPFVSRVPFSTEQSLPLLELTRCLARLQEAVGLLSGLVAAAHPEHGLPSASSGRVPYEEQAGPGVVVACGRAAPDTGSTAAASAPEARTAADGGGETRCYVLSPAAVRHERELLRRYRAEDLCGLLEELHRLLAGVVKLMKSTHPDVGMRGHVISSLGCLLDHALALAARMRNVYVKVGRVR